MQNNTKTKQKDNFWQSQSCPLTPYKLITLIVKCKERGEPQTHNECRNEITNLQKPSLQMLSLFSVSLSLTLCVCKGVRETVYQNDPVQI